MKCRICKRDIPDNSIFCCWCGEKQLRERKKKDEIKVPKPRQLKSGKWNIELHAECGGNGVCLVNCPVPAGRAVVVRFSGVSMHNVVMRQSFGTMLAVLQILDSVQAFNHAFDSLSGALGNGQLHKFG